MIPCDFLDGDLFRLMSPQDSDDGGDIQTNFSRIHALYAYFEMNPKLIKDKIVVDFGAGNGALAVGLCKLGAKRVIAIDYNDDALQCCKDAAEKYNVDIEVIKYIDYNKIYGDVLVAAGVYYEGYNMECNWQYILMNMENSIPTYICSGTLCRNANKTIKLNNPNIIHSTQLVDICDGFDSSSWAASDLKIEMYEVGRAPHEVEPAKKRRAWMDKNQHAYRCVPLSIANTYGWDILLPADLDVEWDGGDDRSSVKIHGNDHLYDSHFASGTFTIQSGNTWKTPEDHQIMCMPIPNPDQYDIISLTAIMESDRLMYPWFVTCKITRPGRYQMPAGTPISRVVPIKLGDIIDSEISTATESEEYREYRRWQTAVRNNKPEDVKWQKFYHKVARYTSIKSPRVHNNDA